MNVLVNKTISCDSDNTSVKYYLSELDGNISEMYDKTNSFIIINASMDNGVCNYHKYIYLTNGKYTLGTINNPIEDKNIASAKIN